MLLLMTAALVAAPCAAWGDGLPVGNVDVGREGVVVPGSPDRIVALTRSSGTLVMRIEREGGRVQSVLRLREPLTIPGVALDGTPDGRSYDGRTAVLIRPRAHGAFPQQRTRLVILGVRPLKVRRRVTLRGDFSFDALSPDGRRMFLVNYVSRRDPRKYVVRSFDVRAGRLEPGAIVDAREPDEDMRGYPVTRATSADGRWVYTLYDGVGEPFVHALDTIDRDARCIDLPMLAGQADPYALTLRLGPGGLIVGEGDRPVVRVDTRTFEPTAIPPRRSRPPERRASGDGGVDWWIAGFFSAFGIAVVVLARRRRRGARAR